MGLAAPDLVEYLVRQPLRFGHSRRIRWIHLAGGMLFVTLALFGLIPEDGDFPSGTLYQPILSYVHIGFFLLLGILGLALGWRLNWKLLLHAEGLEIDPAWGDPLHISWDQIANVRRRWHAEVRITTQKGRRVAFYGRFDGDEELEAFLSGVAWIGRPVPFNGRGLTDALRNAVRRTTLTFKSLARDKRERRTKGYKTLIGVSLLTAAIVLLFVFEFESLAAQIIWAVLLLAAVADLIYRYWRGGRKYPDTIEVSRRGVTSRSETGRTTFLSWGDLSAAQFKKTKAGIEIRSVDGSRVLRVGELRYEPLFWQIFWAMGGASWVMGGARPSDT
ncbi:MAG: hypothetical protein MI785_18270 [Kiloniellales bacterium]|nr:hypothetical protein [Kiloniellales bacterium]